MKDSGARQEFETGARRDLQTGKGRPDLIPTLFIQRLGVVMEKGAEKYGDRNWEKGMPLSRYYASAMRHLMQAFDGDTDEDHLGQCAFNVAALMWTINEIDTGRLPEHLDDRPFARDAAGPLSTAGWIGAGTKEDPVRPKDTAVQSLEGGPSMFADDTYSVTPAGEQLLSGVEYIEPDDEVRKQEMRNAGLVECFDGVWRPRTSPEGTPVVTPIYAQPAVFDPPLTTGGSDQENPETGDWV